MKYAELLPPLSTDEFEALRASIEQEWIGGPIIVDEQGEILDGHHRYKIDPNAPRKVVKGLTEAEKEAFVFRVNYARRNLSPDQKEEVYGRMGEVARRLNTEGKTQPDIAILLGIRQQMVSELIPITENGNGYKPHDFRVKIPKSEHKSIYERVKSGEPQQQIAADFGVAQSSISKIVRRIDREKGKAQKKRRETRAFAEKMCIEFPDLYVGHAENLDFLADESVDVIITSPPYNLGRESWPMGGDKDAKGWGRERRENGIGYEDTMPEDEYQMWQLKCLQEWYRVSRSGASLFYNHKARQGDGAIIHPIEWLKHPDNPWIIRQEIVWDRGSTHNHSATLFWPHDERIYWMTKGAPALPSKSIGQSTVWSFHGPVANTWHPAPFPEELPKRCLQAVGRPGIIVLDPFGGSMTTPAIAFQMGYKAIGVDISQEYIQRAAEEHGWTNTK